MIKSTKEPVIGSRGLQKNVGNRASVQDRKRPKARSVYKK